MIHVGGEREFAAACRDHEAHEALSIQHHFAVEPVLGVEGAGFGEDVSGAGIVHLNFGERAVLPEDGEGAEKRIEIRTGGPIRHVVGHEVRREEIGPIASGAVTLRNAGQIESCGAEEVVLDGEAGRERICGIAGAERAEQIGSHAGVEILANLEGDLDFFGEWKGHVVS